MYIYIYIYMYIYIYIYIYLRKRDVYTWEKETCFCDFYWTRIFPGYIRGKRDMFLWFLNEDFFWIYCMTFVMMDCTRYQNSCVVIFVAPMNMVCCSVLHCVAVCCSAVLYEISEFLNLDFCSSYEYGVLQCVAVCCSVWCSVWCSVCCSVLLCAAVHVYDVCCGVCCSVLPWAAVLRL